MALTNRQAAELLQAVGHPPHGLERRENGYWYAHCSCGYVSARRRTDKEAAGALIHHMRKIANQLIADGVSLPAVVSARR